MDAIYKRELKSYFITPIGYIFCGMFLAVSGLLFSYLTLLNNGADSTDAVSQYFVYLIIVFAVLLPLLTMKLFSEDRRSRSEQILLTSPVSITGMVMGKYLAAVTIYAVTFLVNSLNFVLLYIFCKPNLSVIFANILGIFLVGCAFLAIGLFLSALTENQLIAAVTSIGVTVSTVLVDLLAEMVSVEWIRVALKWFSFSSRYVPFANEVLDVTSIIYYISFAAVFLFLTVRVYEKRRWA